MGTLRIMSGWVYFAMALSGYAGLGLLVGILLFVCGDRIEEEMFK